MTACTPRSLYEASAATSNATIFGSAPTAAISEIRCRKSSRGAMNAMTYGRHINAMYEDLQHPRKIGHLMLAIDPDRFAGGATLEATVDAVVKDLKTQGDILFPGEPELIEQEKRRVAGIPVDDAALADMHAWSRKLGVPPPTEASR